MKLMDSKVCLVTGSTSGIGKEIALGLASLGATVVLHGRSRERGETVLEEIREKTGNNSLELALADFSSFGEVRRFATQFKERYANLTVLVNNAGIWLPKRRLTEDGVEMTFAVNHLAHFLLTNLLIEWLKKSAPSRIVNVSSAAHYGASIDFANLKGERAPASYGAYKQSKLANVLFTYELAELLKGTRVVANCLHPGTVRTRLVREHKMFGPIWRWFPFFVGAEKGARTALYLSSSPDMEDVSGRYYASNKEVRSSDESYDAALRKKLWEVSSQLTELSRLEGI